jgi:hypothetical protein
MYKIIKILLALSCLILSLTGCSHFNNNASIPISKENNNIETTIEEHNPQILQQDDPLNNLPEPVHVDSTDIN